jgi:hypothetical protein
MPVVHSSEKIKYWEKPNISLELKNDNYKDVYSKMITTFKFDDLN